MPPVTYAARAVLSWPMPSGSPQRRPELPQSPQGAGQFKVPGETNNTDDLSPWRSTPGAAPMPCCTRALAMLANC